ncbi:MAG: type VI secretion system ATPase TssH [Planctomycetaceae bacterium]|nr:type VI secretion system ATPase TssH [Planctomycetaceae bacterium]
MVSVNLKSLVARLNDTCRRALEGAAGFCLSRTHHNVEIEHWLVKLLEESNTDLEAILRHYGIDHSRLAADLTRALDRLQTGNARPPGLSPDIVQLAREGWMLASVEFAAGATRSGYLLAALLADENLARIARGASTEFEKINATSLIQDLPGLIADTSEAAQVAAVTSAGSDAGPAVQAGGSSKTPSLDQFTIDLTARAKNGEIDPIIGRDDEIRQVIDILTRRRQNNPIITGEPGVGKTAAVEGFALRIAAGDVPEPLQNVSLRSLDLSLLQAGAGVKGEFENRLKSVIAEVKASPQPIILFIDEAHTLIGAGGSAGQGDAANLLKPALARGELRTIAATTWAEYKKYFERDAALARRFQVVKVEEPSESVGISMIRGMVETLEKHHQVRILDEAVVDAVKLSNRYISGRQLPDKAVSLIDTACARVAIGQFATPARIEDLERRIGLLDVELEILNRETVTGADHAERLQESTTDRDTAAAELAALQQQWNDEKDLVCKIRDLRQTLEGGSEEGDSDPQALRLQLAELTSQLQERQGESGLMQVCVDSQAVADVVSNWTGIPVGRMVSDEIKTVLNLREEMEKRVVGQSHGLEAIAQSIRTSRAKMKDPQRPIGVFMLAGPSGVGKTETAITVAELLYGGEQNMTTINMSEFKEEHKVSLLMGSPPGYVGYGEGGVLTEAVRRRPYSVVLLDELEKSHEGVQEVFYQVFDKGILRDGEGRDIDFKNTVIIMTSNAGTDLIMKLCADPDLMPDPEGLKEALHEELLKTFKPAFLGRCNIIPYFPLGDDVLKGIIELKLGKIVRRFHENYRAELTCTPEVVNAILQRCQEVASGARNVDNIVNGTLLPELSGEFLSRMADGLPINRATISVSDTGGFEYQVE